MIKKKKRNKVNKNTENTKCIKENIVYFQNKEYNLETMSIEEIKKLKSKVEKYKNSVEVKLEALVE